MTQDRLRIEQFDGLTHTELRRRARVLEVLSHRTPVPVDGAVCHAPDNGAGDVAAWWFTPDGRGLLLTFDHESPLSLYDRGSHADQRRYYDGVPDDLVALAEDRGDEPLLNVPDDGSPRIHVATGVFWSAGGAWFAAEGLARVIAADDGLAWDDTGLDLCLHPYELDSGWTVDDLGALAEEYGADPAAVRAAFTAGD